MASVNLGDDSVIWRDDFADGFSVGRPGGDAKWNQHEKGGCCFDDGIATTGSDGLTIVPKGINPRSGEPAFTQSLGHAPRDAALPGVLDHVKWFAYANHISASGFYGFDTIPGHTIRVAASLGGRTFGTEHHPFGMAVEDVDRDFRLGAAAMVTMDTETNIVFNFFLTNTQIFALYERAPFARGTLGDYAAFSFAVPVGARTPSDVHQLAISYDRDANIARWFVDDSEVHAVDRVGRHLDRRYMVIDVGGEEQVIALNQLVCGLGMFTLMDASFDGGHGLIDLYGYPQFFNTALGEPHPLDYVDPHSLATSRLFGQGAQIRCRSFAVSRR